MKVLSELTGLEFRGYIQKELGFRTQPRYGVPNELLVKISIQTH